MEIEGELRWWGKRLDSELKHVKLIIISDVHYGHPLFSMKHFQRTLDYIGRNDDCYSFLNGDLLETATKSSVSNVYRQIKPPRNQRDDMIDLLLPIKHKVLGMTTGNHEWRVCRDSDSDFSEDISKALGVPYRPSGMALKILFGDGSRWTKGKPFSFKGYCTHGYGGARTKAAKAVKAERLAAYVSADFYAMSHDHDVNAAPLLTLDADERSVVDSRHPGFVTGKVTAHEAKLIKTNAYLKWGDYSEMGGFAPTTLSTPLILLLTPKSPYWELSPDRPTKAVKVLI